MLKCKVSKKELKENYNYRISVNIGRAYYLLRYQSPRFYYSNNYGWRFDVYELDYHTILTTGYEYLETNKNQDKINDIIDKYDELAYNIYRYNKSYETEQEEIDNILNKCVKELKEVLYEI